MKVARMQNPKNPLARIMKLGMLLCCALMLAPVIWFLTAGGTLAGLAANWTLFLPLAICAGAHFLMNRKMGASCHGQGEPAGMNPDESLDPTSKGKETP